MCAAAWAYINIMLSTDVELEFSKKLNYGVTNRKVVHPPAPAARITPLAKGGVSALRGHC
jgi:hypothetical protein